MQHARWSAFTIGRVNPLVPAAVALAGLVWFLAGNRWIGAGIAVGAVLALVNGVLLSRRVDIAADLAGLGQAMLVMQIGLLVTCAVMGAAIVILARLSLAMAVAAVVGFAVTQMAILATFFWTRARVSAPVVNGAAEKEAR
jgi:hypothetical protein